jgi:hypothetical protein
LANGVSHIADGYSPYAIRHSEWVEQKIRPLIWERFKKNGSSLRWHYPDQVQWVGKVLEIGRVSNF